jgi:hypothetical protein
VEAVLGPGECLYIPVNLFEDVINDSVDGGILLEAKALALELVFGGSNATGVWDIGVGVYICFCPVTLEVVDRFFSIARKCSPGIRSRQILVDTVHNHLFYMSHG